MPTKRIEYPAQGETYYHEKFGVYEYSTYERSSVLAGQTRRRFIAMYDSFREAKENHPDAEFAG